MNLTIEAVLSQVLLDMIWGKTCGFINCEVGQTFGRFLGIGVLHPVRGEGSSEVAKA